MNESILKALMRLFAIIANADSNAVSESARKVVINYLSVMLNKKHIDIYINIFDEFVKIYHHAKRGDKQKVRKQTSLNSVKVLKICSEINEELNQKEKIVVLIRLLEFVNENEVITEKEYDFVKTVSDIFNISDTEFKNIYNLAISEDKVFEDSSKVITISNKKESNSETIVEKNIDGKFVILHVESTNTFIVKYIGNESFFINNQNIAPKRLYIFDHGAVIKGPKINSIYYSDIASKFILSDTNAIVEFKAEDIEFHYKNTENGIQKFSFYEQSGRMIGIMGGSGVGKSTLLNVFNGNYPLHAGKITINGYDLHKDKEKLNGVIGFVPQDDLLIEELTVYENLYYNAKLCFNNFSETEIIDAVEKVLNDLDLTSTKDLTVGSPINKFISGGQRKRVNIALELIREPSILIVDEPTSGLSSMDSDMVMNLLKEQALKGKLVLVNIHQPSSDIYKLFDTLLMIDKGGYPVYYGNPVDAITYFKESANYVNYDESGCSVCGNLDAEQPLQILEAKIVDEFGKYTKERKVSPQEWYVKYKNEIETKQLKKEEQVNTKKTQLPSNFFKTPSKFKQFLIFTKRNIKAKLTNKQYLLITFLEAPILAVILGYFTKYISGTETNPDAYIFAENINIVAYLFMAVTVALFFGMTLSAEEIIKDRKILKREKFLHLSKFSYLNSKIIVLFLISAIQILSFIIVGNLILGIKGMTFSYWIVLFSAAAFANILGLNISSSFDSVVTIYIIIPFILVPQLLFSGVIVDFTKLHKNFTSYKDVPIIGDLMTSRWAYEALIVNQFKNNKYEKYYYDVDQEKSQNNFKLTYLVPEFEKYTNTCSENISKNKNIELTSTHLLILKNEISELNKTSSIKFKDIEEINLKSFNKNLQDELHKYFEKLKRFYNSKQYKLNLKSDSVSHFLLKKFGSKEDLFKIKQENHNKKISEILRNKGEFDAIKEEDNRMIQVIDPIFKIPENKNGRAHFYSPIKRIGNYSIDTFWFNIMFIWLTSIILYLALIFNLFRKFVDSFSKNKR